MIDISTDKSRLQRDRIHGWLASTYWSPGISRDLVERAIAGSTCVGAYRDGVQIGFARAITDGATFAWLADVFVDEAARGQGIGRAMVSHLTDLPELAGLRRWMLATRDAHSVYAPLGFAPIDQIADYMIRRPAAAPEPTA
ncbi:GNAT family N-acetyltransferase [Sphingomonas desiccabilis]|uniref:N-acetyltransferase n=1 Tax=Sphingomonas desiccabilis TaxID=429134 RepID=A0A4Q2IM02_9SPHN|nr:GNAT family N-acetyltransferase [Sphingomonas desiccabilis]MBB3912114.1 GNAT superfamily N-acetyltransferase [Sphingomonas desiccabilis]RXZ30279.1 N-acetyltransferase [Sphingomonas desiccabilis]